MGRRAPRKVAWRLIPFLGVSIGNLGGFLGPAAIGLAKSATGSYAASLQFIAACLAFGAVIVIWERARPLAPL